MTKRERESEAERERGGNRETERENKSVIPHEMTKRRENAINFGAKLCLSLSLFKHVCALPQLPGAAG